MLSRKPTLAELLNHLKDRGAADIRVALPGRIESFDADSKLADVQPLLSERWEVENGIESVQLPVIPSVPVIFPGSGPWRIQFPVKKGDEVLLVFGDRSLDVWQSQGGVTDPDDQRRHHLTDAVAILGLASSKNRTADAIADDVITIGKDGEDADFVAVSTKTKDEITKLHDTVRDGFSTISTAITAISSHTHPYLNVTTPSNTTPSVALASLQSPSGPSDVGDVNSSTVKVKG